MLKKIILICVFGFSLLNSINSIASAVEATIQFKNEDSQGSARIVSTMKPYLDNFSWINIRPGYNAVWHFPTRVQSFKNVDQFSLAPQESASALLSYYWNDNWYGMSQYAFNYANRSKEYGCFVTELRLSGMRWQTHNYNIVIASYRQDPTHLDDYLTCYAEKNAATAFTIHMGSSKNKQDEKNKTDDNQRYSVVGDTKKLQELHSYGIDRPIELWKDQNNHLVFMLANDKSVPVVTTPQKPPAAPEYALTINLINNTSKVLVPGQPKFDKWSQLSSKYYVAQPSAVQPGITNLMQFKGYNLSVAALNYHFADYAEDSGCYIVAATNVDQTDISANAEDPINASDVYTFYLFDRNHNAPEKNLYCFISRDVKNEQYKVTVTFYENAAAVKEPVDSDLDSLNVSYSFMMFNVFNGTVIDSYRTSPFYDKGAKLITTGLLPLDISPLLNYQIFL